MAGRIRGSGDAQRVRFIVGLPVKNKTMSNNSHIPRRDFLRNTAERIQKAVERATGALGGKKSADKRLKARKEDGDTRIVDLPDLGDPY